MELWVFHFFSWYINAIKLANNREEESGECEAKSEWMSIEMEKKKKVF